MKIAMRRWGRLAAALLGSLAAVAGASGIPDGDDFGAGITLAEAAELGDVVADPQKYAGGAILLRGRITDVCQRKGCWLVLSDGAHDIRIRFADYGFFVPKDCRGRQAYVEGDVSVETLSEREARHFAEESSQGDPEEIHGPQEVVSFVATGVRILPGD